MRIDKIDIAQRSTCFRRNFVAIITKNNESLEGTFEY